jgi:hypothetical protein
MLEAQEEPRAERSGGREAMAFFVGRMRSKGERSVDPGGPIEQDSPGQSGP